MSHIRFAWVLNIVLIMWILAHALPQLNIETRIYPPESVLPDGSRYYGETLSGKFHGQGKLVYSNGDYYEGMFREGMMSGQGKFTFSDGGYYQGEFQLGAFHGEGYEVFSNGTTYKGGFKNDDYSGYGMLTYADGEVFEGDFENGELVSGKHIDAEGASYEGDFLDYVYHGQGVLRSAEGDVYTGDFEDGEMQGTGEYVSIDGARYKGEFQASTFHGDGIYEGTEGERYEGQFEFGTYHGQGQLTFLDAEGNQQTQTGLWQWGRFQNDKQVNELKRVTADAVLYNQNVLLENTKKQLSFNNPDQIDLYFIGVAGDGSQDVFLREIEEIQARVEDAFSLQGKNVLLVNHAERERAYPLATNHSFKQVVNTVAEKMDTEQDILLLYMTSHGSDDHVFYINDIRLRLDGMSAESMSETLNESGIRWRVVIVSACYSGGFIKGLENEHTMVLTSAREDRRSFGCSNESEMTYFGKAYFREAFNENKTFSQIFKDAVVLIDQWENEEGIEEHSEPQIYIGTQIEAHLNRWRESFIRQTANTAESIPHQRSENKALN